MSAYYQGRVGGGEGKGGSWPHFRQGDYVRVIDNHVRGTVLSQRVPAALITKRSSSLSVW